MLQVVALAFLLETQAQPTPAVRRWEQMDYGPFLATALTMPVRKGAVLPRGIVIRVGSATVCFDPDLLRMAAGWTDGGLTLLGPPFDGSRSPDGKTRPVPNGTVRFATRAGPGWAREGSFKDPRTGGGGPLPADWARWKGLYVHGNQVVLSYAVGGCPVLEVPGFESRDSVWAFTRTFRIGASAEPLELFVCEAGSAGGIGGLAQENFKDRAGPVRSTIAVAGEVAVGVACPGGAGQMDLPPETAWEITGDGRLVLKIPPRESSVLFRLVLGSAKFEDREPFRRCLRDGEEDPAGLVGGGPSRQPEAVATKGALGAQGGAYEVDTLTLPEENPSRSWLRFAGLGFFEDGRAALCTWSGDVWIVSGIDAPLQDLRWRRFASGLFQPCGLAIVGGAVFVAGRDQITRLRDLNGDGEADFYENFNNGITEKGNYHEFVMDLHADGEGNLYTVKGALGANFPAGPAAAHHGCLLKISKDGARMEIVATGIRAGAGMGLGPKGEITVSDNDGHWGPSSRLNLVRPGGYYGDPGTAHRSPVPKEHDPPLCWIHRSVDNSSGGEVWVPGEAWGPFQGRMLHLSYGTCSLFHVLHETVEGVAQGGVVRFPLAFASGILRARFHPKDGQLYVAGLKGWSTSAARDGCFQRVRWTGKPFTTVREMHVRKDGIELVFTHPLKAESASDLDGWSAQWWNYAYTEKYGSPDYSVATPKKQGRDAVEIKAARVSRDGRTVFLEIAELRPVMQMLIRYRLRAADGSPVNEEIWHTIHRVPK